MICWDFYFLMNPDVTAYIKKRREIGRGINPRLHRCDKATKWNKSQTGDIRKPGLKSGRPVTARNHWLEYLFAVCSLTTRCQQILHTGPLMTPNILALYSPQEKKKGGGVKHNPTLIQGWQTLYMLNMLHVFIHTCFLQRLHNKYKFALSYFTKISYFDYLLDSLGFVFAKLYKEIPRIGPRA